MQKNNKLNEILDDKWNWSQNETFEKSEIIEKLKIDRNKRKKFKNLDTKENIFKENFDMFTTKIYFWENDN